MVTTGDTKPLRWLQTGYNAILTQSFSFNDLGKKLFTILHTGDKDWLQALPITEGKLVTIVPRGDLPGRKFGYRTTILTENPIFRNSPLTEKEIEHKNRRR